MDDADHSVFRRKRVVLIILAAALLCAVGWRATGIVRKGFPQHDEVVSYLHATGNTLGYVEVPPNPAAPFGQWTPASTWQAFIHPVSSPFASITKGLGVTDVAPPLYYWILNLWLRAFGWGPTQGLWLNCLFALGTLAALFGFARLILRDDLHAALVCLVWAVMPPAIDVSLMSRQYDLLAFAAVGLLWAVALLSDPERRPGAGGAALVAAFALIGSLSQHLFVVSMAVALLLSVMRAWRARRAAVAWTAGAMAAGWALSWPLNPYLLAQLARQSGREGALSGVGVGTILHRVLDTVAAAFGLSPRVNDALTSALHGASPSVVVVAALVAALAVALVVPRSRAALAAGWARVAAPGLAEWALVAGLIGGITLVTVLSAKGVGVVPSRYLSVVWPLLAFVPVLAARALRTERATVVCVLVFVLLLMGADYVTYARGPRPPDARSVFASATHVVLDDPARGMALRYMWMIPAGTQTYVAWRRDLVADPAWAGTLAAGDVIVLSDPYQPVPVPTDAVLALLSTRWKLERVGRTAVPGLAYRLAPL